MKCGMILTLGSLLSILPLATWAGPSINRDRIVFYPAGSEVVGLTAVRTEVARPSGKGTRLIQGYYYMTALPAAADERGALRLTLGPRTQPGAAAGMEANEVRDWHLYE